MDECQWMEKDGWVELDENQTDVRWKLDGSWTDIGRKSDEWSIKWQNKTTKQENEMDYDGMTKRNELQLWQTMSAAMV
jgi:hypothetical protein